MICDYCTEAGKMDVDVYDVEAIKIVHGQCKGETHCNCQHRITKKMPDGSLAQVEASHVTRNTEDAPAS